MNAPTRQHRRRWQYSLSTLVLVPPFFAVIFWMFQTGFAAALLSFMLAAYGTFAVIAFGGLCFGLAFKRLGDWFHKD